MVTANQIKALMKAHKVNQLDVAGEWGKLTVGEPKYQSAVSHMLSKEIIDSTIFLQAVSNLTGVPVYEIIKEGQEINEYEANYGGVQKSTLIQKIESLEGQVKRLSAGLHEIKKEIKKMYPESTQE